MEKAYRNAQTMRFDKLFSSYILTNPRKNCTISIESTSQT